jgi:nifR3 family TIM-barrel protein
MYLKPLRIKNLTLSGNLFLAPMAEITNYPLRIIALKNGCDMVISEMVSSNALFYKNKKTLEMIKVRDDRPICIQIFGSDPDIMTYASILVEENGADMVEVNAGCPVKKIVKTGSGSSLLKNPLLLSSIVYSIARRIKIPVSVKIRSGIDEKNKNAVEIAKIVEESGASMVHIHLRTVSQGHSGNVDYEIADEIKSKIKIPLIVNGGVTDPKKAIEMFKKTGADGISIARGFISNPYIFDDIKKYINEGKIIERKASEKANLFQEYLKIAAKEFGEKCAIVNSRRIAGMWISGFRNATDFRNRYMRVQTLDEALRIIEEIKVRSENR